MTTPERGTLGPSALALPPLPPYTPRRYTIDGCEYVDHEVFEEWKIETDRRERILQARIAELTSALADKEADAARYRWLRDQARIIHDEGPLVFMADDWGNAGDVLDGKALDAAIDAARGA